MNEVVWPENRDGLKRTLGLFPVTNIVIANMIGAGIFTTSGLLMADLRNPTVMLVLWGVGGAIALCGALSYGALGAAMPAAGGEYVFLARLYNPMIGFLSGWTSFIVGFSAPIAASAIGFSAYFTGAFPQFADWGTTSGFLNPQIIQKVLAISVIVLFTFIHLRRLAFGAQIQNYLTAMKVALIVGLIVLGIFWGRGEISHFSARSVYVFDFSGWKTIGLAIMWIMFAYSGWNAAAYIGSEIKNPSSNLPRSLFLGTGLVMVLYLSLNILYIYAIAPSDMAGVIAIGALAVKNLFGGAIETTFSLLIAFALFSSLSAFMILGPRVYYAMARDGYFFRFVSEVHPVTKVPYKAIVLQSGIAVVIVLSGTFDEILSYMGFALGIFPILAVAGLFKWRILPDVHGQLPGFPVVPAVYVISAVAILILAFFERPVASSIAIMTVLSGVPVFFLFRKNLITRSGSTPR